MNIAAADCLMDIFGLKRKDIGMNHSIEINIKLMEDADIPMAGSLHSAGYDFKIIGLTLKQDTDGNDILVLHTGVYMEIPKGYFLGLYLRSSTPKEGLILANHVGIIDSDYRGEIKGWCRPTVENKIHLDTFKERLIGKKLLQGILHRQYALSFNVVENISDTERGTGGFGSTGE